MNARRMLYFALVLTACNASKSGGSLPGASSGGSGGGGASSGDSGGGSGGSAPSKGGSGGSGDSASSSSASGGSGGDSTGSGGSGAPGAGGSGGVGGDASSSVDGLPAVGGARTVATTDAGGSAGAGLGGTGGGPAGAGEMGAPCESAQDCAQSYTCYDAGTGVVQVNSDGDLGSVAHGICTATCETSDDCAALDGASVCVGFTQDTSDPGYCMPSCTPGDDNVDCQARPDMVCNLFPTGDDGDACSASSDCTAAQVCSTTCIGVLPICMPNCASDADCPSDRFCDLTSGSCVENAPTGSDVGDVCETDTDCKSNFCAEGICTRVCTVGVNEGCGPVTSPLDEFCFPIVDVAIDPGDAGRCWSLCDCDTDCANGTCLSFQDTDVESALGRAGFCGQMLSGDIELTCN